MKNTNTINNTIVSLLTDDSNNKLVRVKNILKNLNNKIQVFSKAIDICNSFQDSDSFFELTKKAMKAFSEKKKDLKVKLEKIGNAYTNVHAYGMNIASNIETVKQTSRMCNVEYYRDIAEKNGLTTNDLMEVKKLASTLYLFNARMAKRGIRLEQIPQKLLRICFCGGAVHSYHQQECNHGEWLEYLNCEENRKLYNACGFTVPQEYVEE